MDVEKIEELIKVLEHSRTEELCVQKGNYSVSIRKGKKPAPAPSAKKAHAHSPRTDVQQAANEERFVLAQMVGIFHTVDGIAKVGGHVSTGQVVGSIESMKLLNDVISDVTGIIREVLVEDGTPVEYGQPLCRVEPA